MTDGRAKIFQRVPLMYFSHECIRPSRSRKRDDSMQTFLRYRRHYLAHSPDIFLTSPRYEICLTRVRRQTPDEEGQPNNFALL